MEPQSNLYQMQSKPFEEILKPLISPYIGQRALWELAYQRLLAGIFTSLKAVLPTGYGKTLAGLGCYFIARELGLVNRLLVLVPTDEQRRQWAKGAQENARLLGSTINKALSISEFASAFRYHQLDKAEIFVASYQQLCGHQKSFIDELMNQGNWMVIYDEFHHLAEERAWGQNAAVLERDSRGIRYALMMSATPVRTDQKPTFGGGFVKGKDNEWIFQADVQVSLKDALEEEAIRTPEGKIEHYFVDVQIEGEDAPRRITTTQLREDGITDFDKFETRKRLRYVHKYLSKILIDAVEALYFQNLEHPHHHQMLVFAMTCRHAEAVCAQLNSITHKGFADWIGVIRSDKENRGVLDRYKNNKLECLVQVDKAGEGFNNVRTSVLVFLNLIRSHSKLYQQLGRGLRRNHDLPFNEDILLVFASADTEIADLLNQLAIELALVEKKKGKDDDDEDWWAQIPKLAVIGALFERLEVVNPQVGQRLGDAESSTLRRIAEKWGAPQVVLENNLDWLRKALSPQLASSSGDAQETAGMDEADVRTYYRDQVDTVVGIWAQQAAKMHGRRNGGFEHTWIGDFKKRINSKWKGIRGLSHSEMMADEFIQKYNWVREGFYAMKEAKEIPEWLRLL